MHTVLVNGRVVKYGHRLVGVDLAAARRAAEGTVEYLMGEMGPEAWRQGMNPEIPELELHDNPYTYTYTGETGRQAAAGGDLSGADPVG